MERTKACGPIYPGWQSIGGSLRPPEQNTTMSSREKMIPFKADQRNNKTILKQMEVRLSHFSNKLMTIELQ